MKSVMIEGEEHLVIANTGKFVDKEVHKEMTQDEHDQLEESIKAYELTMKKSRTDMTLQE